MRPTPVGRLQQPHISIYLHLKERFCSMWHALTALVSDEAGFIVSSELTLISTIGVLGMIAGLTEVAQNVNGELRDLGGAYAHLNQSYSLELNGVRSAFADQTSNSAELGQ